LKISSLVKNFIYLNLFAFIVLLSIISLQSCNDNHPEVVVNPTKVEQVSDDILIKQFQDRLPKSKIRKDENLLKTADFAGSRSCAPGCEYDIYDCDKLENCYTDPVVVITDYALCVTYQYAITRCQNPVNGTYFFQITDFSWEPALPAPQCLPEVYLAYDINYPNNNPTLHFGFQGLLVAAIMNQIENYIFANYLGSSTGQGNIITAIPKFCYAKCPVNNRYVECGLGCCVRMTFFTTVNGTVQNEFSQVANPGCHNTLPIAVKCNLTPGEIAALGCDIGNNCLYLDN
jgi:hypothetical protein